MNVTLRPMALVDLPMLYSYSIQPQGVQMTAVKARTWAEFTVHKNRILIDQSCCAQVIEFEGQVAGDIGSWNTGAHREVGYLLGHEFWGRGIATNALRLFLQVETIRPLRAMVEVHNQASRRVLEKNGFRWVSTQPCPPDARWDLEIEESCFVRDSI